MDLNKLSEKELIALAKDNNANAMEFLLERYKYIAVRSARSYFLLDGDENDLVQEGTIALYKGIMSFNEEKSNIETYLRACVKNRLLDAIKKSNNNNNLILSKSISLSIPDKVDEDKNEFLEDKGSGPEEVLISKENTIEIKEKIKEILSKNEFKIFDLYFLQGYTYRSIAQQLNLEVKSVDNAIQRIKKKLKKHTKK